MYSYFWLLCLRHWYPLLIRFFEQSGELSDVDIVDQIDEADSDGCIEADGPGTSIKKPPPSPMKSMKRPIDPKTAGVRSGKKRRSTSMVYESETEKESSEEKRTMSIICSELESSYNLNASTYDCEVMDELFAVCLSRKEVVRLRKKDMNHVVRALAAFLHRTGMLEPSDQVSYNSLLLLSRVRHESPAPLQSTLRECIQNLGYQIPAISFQEANSIYSTWANRISNTLSITSPGLSADSWNAAPMGEFK